ncbi:hypothetical protein [Tessaracoccus defluvii]|uniref:hypothetical protein n=1 Tax=Tessaracoccus defluvii TaxID=1285901 RepID=UPI0031D40F09
MPLTRRTLLIGAGLALAGCAPSPVISGAPALPVSPPAPTQAPEAAAAQLALTLLDATLAGLEGAAFWTAQPWLGAARAQCEAHLARVGAPDPLSSDEQPLFGSATPEVAVPADAAAATAALEAARTGAVTALEAGAQAAGDGALRLLYASAATGVTALADTTLPPLALDAAPRRLQESTLAAAQGVALGHAWALIYGLGVGVGRLAGDDPLVALAMPRLAAVKHLRNELREALGASAPSQPAAFELPTAMDTPEAIRQGWAALETRLLEGYAHCVAADPAPRWRQLMAAQVAPVQAVGGQLGHWPGWVA